MEDQVLRDKLTGELTQVPWAPLAPHNARGHLWLVQDLNLVEVAMAVATNRLQVVSEWIQTGQMRRPTAPEISHWETTPGEQQFDFLIVQPFVLAMEIAGPTH